MWRWKQPNTIQRHPKTKGSWNFASSSISPILIYSDHFDSFWTFSLNITAALFPKCLCFAGSPSSTWWWERNLSCCRGQCISGIPRPIFSAQRLAQGNTFFWIIKSVNSQISMKPISHLKSNINPVTSSFILNVPQNSYASRYSQVFKRIKPLAPGEKLLKVKTTCGWTMMYQWGVNYRKPWEKGDLTLGKWHLWGFRQGTIETWPAKKGNWWDL